MHIQTHIHKHTCAYTYKHVQLHIYTHKHVYTHKHGCTYKHVHTHLPIRHRWQAMEADVEVPVLLLFQGTSGAGAGPHEAPCETFLPVTQQSVWAACAQPYGDHLEMGTSCHALRPPKPPKSLHSSQASAGFTPPACPTALHSCSPSLRTPTPCTLHLIGMVLLKPRDRPTCALAHAASSLISLASAGRPIVIRDVAVHHSSLTSGSCCMGGGHPSVSLLCVTIWPEDTLGDVRI